MQPRSHEGSGAVLPAIASLLTTASLPDLATAIQYACGIVLIGAAGSSIHISHLGTAVIGLVILVCAHVQNAASKRAQAVPTSSPLEFGDALGHATRLVPRLATGARVTLVGAGPGSPDLLTIAAYHALKTADVVISDRIASTALHALVKPGAQLHIAGKIPGRADAAQEEVNAWGIQALREGKRVVRLKVGDPYLYGRGGEEYQFYASHGYAPDVIPGVCSAMVAPLIAGIPITHRGVANSLLISTGQGKGGTFPDLPTFDAGRTLVLLMAVGRIPKLYEDLTSRGYPSNTPVAVVERATHADERVLRTSLETLHAQATAAGVASPAIIIVGEACRALEGAMADIKAAGLPITFGPAGEDFRTGISAYVGGKETREVRPWALAPIVTAVSDD